MNQRWDSSEVQVHVNKVHIIDAITVSWYGSRDRASMYVGTYLCSSFPLLSPPRRSPLPILGIFAG